MPPVQFMFRRFWLIGVVVLALAPATARAQSARLTLDKNDLYADLPFVVAIVTEGFDESPTPEQPKLTIDGAKVTPIGVSPNVSTSIQIVNGRRTDSRRVQFVMRYRVEAPKAGTYEIAPVTVSQGAKTATTQGGRVQVSDVQETADMALELSLPDRPVWLGEMVPIEIDWYLRRDVSDHQIVVPIFDLESSFSVVPAAASGRPSLAFQAGSREIELPYSRDTVQRGGNQYTRFRFSALIAPLEAGKIAIPASKVVASLQVGTGRDQFGFPAPRLALFKASDKPRELEVRPPPLANRPASFSGAVGTSFSIAVEAKKSVVQLGEPIDLVITIRGDARLDSLALPKLDAEGSLPMANFSVPDEAPPGELSEDGRTKVFRVAVRVVGKDTREIPPIPFSYFDPTRAAYGTAHSEPIALSVKGSAIVSAGDVVGTTRPQATNGSASPADPTGGVPSQGSLSGADLSLSAPSRTLSAPLSLAAITPLLAAAYTLPLLFFMFLVWRRRTAEDRGERAEIKAARRAMDSAIVKAIDTPATESIGPLTTALRGLARQLGIEPKQLASIIAELETAAFDPTAKNHPIDAALRQRVETMVKDWTTAAKRPGAAATTVTALLCCILATAAARADAAGSGLGNARNAYQAALAKTERAERASGFSRALTLFAEVSTAHPRAPELWIDRGNAALGAGEFGQAVLAYRRALALSPGSARAERNLAWVRANAPAWIPRPVTKGAVDSLFFWHASLTVAQRHLFGAAAFALAFLLFAPIASDRRWRRVCIGAGAVALTVWVAMLASVLLDRDISRDAVIVVDAAELRSADSAGAPLAIEAPLPGGTEVSVAETRSGWARIELADGKSGWIAEASITRVVD